MKAESSTVVSTKKEEKTGEDGTARITQLPLSADSCSSDSTDRQPSSSSAAAAAASHDEDNDEDSMRPGMMIRPIRLLVLCGTALMMIGIVIGYGASNMLVERMYSNMHAAALAEFESNRAELIGELSALKKECDDIIEDQKQKHKQEQEQQLKQQQEQQAEQQEVKEQRERNDNFEQEISALRLEIERLEMELQDERRTGQTLRDENSSLKKDAISYKRRLSRAEERARAPHPDSAILVETKKELDHAQNELDTTKKELNKSVRTVKKLTKSERECVAAKKEMELAVRAGVGGGDGGDGGSDGNGGVVSATLS